MRRLLRGERSGDSGTVELHSEKATLLSLRGFSFQEVGAHLAGFRGLRSILRLITLFAFVQAAGETSRATRPRLSR